MIWNKEESDLDCGFSLKKKICCRFLANPLGHPPLGIFLAQFGHIPQVPSSPFLAIKH